MPDTTYPIINLPLKQEQYVHEARKPKGICLHATAGYSAVSAIEWWNSNVERVATPWCIETNGDRYLCHDEANGWAWHMGSGNNAFEKQTLGIEIVNLGYLTKQGNTLVDAYKKPFCRLDSKELYVEKAWRGQNYWQAYTTPQIKAVALTVRAACEKYGVAKEILSITSRNEFIPNTAMLFDGIFSHQNVISWKTDVGPAFPWEQFLDLVKAG